MRQRVCNGSAGSLLEICICIAAIQADFVANFLIFQVIKTDLESEPIGGGTVFGEKCWMEEQLTCIGYQTAPHEGTKKGMTKSVESSLL